MDALNAARYRSAQYPYAVGLNPCTVQATFKVTAGGESANKLVLDLSATIPSGPRLGLDGTTASRSNEIAVTFTSPVCNPANT